MHHIIAGILDQETFNSANRHFVHMFWLRFKSRLDRFGKTENMFSKGDEVMLASGQLGKILGLVDEHVKTYRIKLAESGDVVYFDESKLALKRKHFINRLLGIK